MPQELTKKEITQLARDNHFTIKAIVKHGSAVEYWENPQGLLVRFNMLPHFLKRYGTTNK